uniref:Uncharacterized protein n=1 Tax=Tanacetum cinerariifolium TaxID=118510 RepID=A0A6L2JDN2_TANCI|nr:hypothetical protein [Tanacetum cinerariifolium]
MAADPQNKHPLFAADPNPNAPSWCNSSQTNTPLIAADQTNTPPLTASAVDHPKQTPLIAAAVVRHTPKQPHPCCEHGDGYGGDTRLLSRGRGRGGGGDGVVSVVVAPCAVNWDVLNMMRCDGEIDDMLRIRLRKAGSGEEIFTSIVWIRSFNINEPIYMELCHEFYLTYEFDEVCADDELQTKKIIKFRLGGRAHSLTLLEFARRLGLYRAAELDEEGFNVYFEGGLHSDEHFNAQEYWYENVAWLIARWMKRKGAGIQKESQICCGQFISKISRKLRVLIDDVLRSLSDLVYCRDLDTTTLRELIDSESRLIPVDPQHGVPRVGIPRPPRPSMQDLYDRMGRIEIRQEAIERIEYRQSYH